MAKAKLQNYREIQAQKEALEAQLAALEGDSELRKTRELIEALSRQIKDSSLSVDAVVYAVREVFGRAKFAAAAQEDLALAPTKGARKPRQAIRYTNPKTGESQVVRRIHGEVAQWKAEFGIEALKPTPVDE